MFRVRLFSGWVHHFGWRSWLVGLICLMTFVSAFVTTPAFADGFADIEGDDHSDAQISTIEAGFAEASDELGDNAVDGLGQAGDSQTLLNPGWNQLESGEWMLGDESGEPLTGWQLIGDRWFYLGSDGIMATGWQLVNNRWYYLRENGAMASSCWVLYNDCWYYLWSNGAMASACWIDYNDRWYYVRGSGIMASSSWVLYNDRWYYVKASGVMSASTWELVNGRWYYLKSSGVMATGWQLINNQWYYLKANGAMSTGWELLNDKWYYLKSNGAMATGVCVVDGVGQSFKSNGEWIGRTIEAQFTQWAQNETSNTNWLILVDTKQCKTAVFYGSKGNWVLQQLWDCAPGKASTPTVKGRFTVGSKGYYFDSKNARCFYFTQFRGNYLFHSVLYYQRSTPSSVMDGRVGMGLSHGCVRLKVENAKWIYDNIPKGTKVYVW